MNLSFYDNKVTIGTYESNTLLSVVKESYLSINEYCPSYWEIYDKILELITDKGISILTYEGVCMDKFMALNNLKYVLEFEKIYHVNSELKVSNDAQTYLIPSLRK